MEKKGDTEEADATRRTDESAASWRRIQEHKIIQWGIAYLGAALALAHGQELIGHAFHWPDVVGRIFMIALVAGFPIALTLAWYHGHRGLQRVSGGELAIISLLVLIGAVFFTVALREPDGSAAHEPASAATPSNAPVDSETARESNSGVAPGRAESDVLPNSVAVLPFENLSPNPNDGYFAAGIHEEVLSQLGKLSNVNVISRTSVARYADTALTIPEIASELRVGSVMEGSVRYANDRVRIAAQLIDATSDRPLWSDVYERDLADVFAIQADIAMNIANALQAEFSVEEQQALEQPPTSSREAYALYLEARSNLPGGMPTTRDTIHALLDRALVFDPGFANAYGLKASLFTASFANTVQGAAVPRTGWAELEGRVREYAQRALDIDPSNRDARVALRQLNILTWNWSAVERTQEAGDEAYLGPTGAWYFAYRRNPGEAVRIGEEMVDINPNDPGPYMILGVSQALAGDRQASDGTLRKGIDLAATPIAWAWLAYNAVVQGNNDQALAHLQLVERLLGPDRAVVFLPELAYAYSRIGRNADAARIFAEIQAVANESEIGSGTWAMAHLAIGDEEQALRSLEAVVERARNHEPEPGFFNVMNLKMNFLADPRIETPRFAELLGRIRGD